MRNADNPRCPRKPFARLQRQPTVPALYLFLSLCLSARRSGILLYDVSLHLKMNGCIPFAMPLVPCIISRHCRPMQHIIFSSDRRRWHTYAEGLWLPRLVSSLTHRTRIPRNRTLPHISAALSPHTHHPLSPMCSPHSIFFVCFHLPFLVPCCPSHSVNCTIPAAAIRRMSRCRPSTRLSYSLVRPYMHSPHTYIHSQSRLLTIYPAGCDRFRRNVLPRLVSSHAISLCCFCTNARRHPYHLFAIYQLTLVFAFAVADSWSY